MKRFLPLLALGVSACSSQQLYLAGQQWQARMCHRLPDAAERERCLKTTATSYEAYRREADKAAGP